MSGYRVKKVLCGPLISQRYGCVSPKLDRTLELDFSATSREQPLAVLACSLRLLRLVWFFSRVHQTLVLENLALRQWLQFLEETHLISWYGFNLVLTADGHAFLRFRFVTDPMVEI